MGCFMARSGSKPRKIYLRCGRYYLIDEADVALVLDRHWHCIRDKKRRTMYLVNQRSTNTPRYLRMHRLILGVTDPSVVVDHINGNGLDNRRANLRLCNSFLNAQNRKKNKNNTSGFIGVTFRKRAQKYEARIMFNRIMYALGSYSTAVEAARAYNKKALELPHAEYRRLNDV